MESNSNKRVITSRVVVNWMEILHIFSALLVLVTIGVGIFLIIHTIHKNTCREADVLFGGFGVATLLFILSIEATTIFFVVNTSYELFLSSFTLICFFLLAFVLQTVRLIKDKNVCVGNPYVAKWMTIMIVFDIIVAICILIPLLILLISYIISSIKPIYIYLRSLFTIVPIEYDIEINNS